MRIITIVSPYGSSIRVDADSEETQFRNLVASLFNIQPSDIKGVKDEKGTHFTIWTLVSNSHLTDSYSNSYTLICPSLPTPVPVSASDTANRTKQETEPKQSVHKPSVPKIKISDDSLANQDSDSQAEATPPKAKHIEYENILNKMMKEGKLDSTFYFTALEKVRTENENIINVFKDYEQGKFDLKRLLFKIITLVAVKSPSVSSKVPFPSLVSKIEKIEHLIDSSMAERLKNLPFEKQKQAESLFSQLSIYSTSDLKKLIKGLKQLVEEKVARPVKVYEVSDPETRKVIESLHNKIKTNHKAILHYVLSFELDLFKKWISEFSQNYGKSEIELHIQEQLEIIFQAKVFNLLKTEEKTVFLVMKEFFKTELNFVYINFIEEKQNLQYLRVSLTRKLLSFKQKMKAGYPIDDYLSLLRQLSVSSKEEYAHALKAKNKDIIGLFQKYYLYPARLERKLNGNNEESVHSSFLKEETIIEEPPLSSDKLVDFPNVVLDLAKKGEITQEKAEYFVRNFQSIAPLKAAWRLYQNNFDKEEFLETIELLSNREESKFLTLMKLDNSESSKTEENLQSTRKINKKIKSILEKIYQDDLISENIFERASERLERGCGLMYSIFEAFFFSKDCKNLAEQIEILVKKQGIFDVMRLFLKRQWIEKSSFELILKEIRKNENSALISIFEVFEKNMDEEDLLSSLEAFLEVNY